MDSFRPRRKFSPPLPHRLEDGVQCLRELVLHFDVADFTGPIPRFQVVDFGDIRIEHDRIVFANGSGLALVPIEERVGVFKVEPPANPALMGGSRLCGDRNITFVTLAQGVDRSLFMKVFDEPSPPIEAFGNLLPQEGACGMYSFSQ